MGKKNFRMPDDAELVRLASASCESAESKLKAAKLLLEGDQWPEAFATAALGFEEMGKAYLCLTVVGIPVQFRDDLPPKQFAALFSGHTAKAQFAHLVLQFLVDDDAPVVVTDLLARAEAAAERTNETKFRGLYVDLGPDGILLHPKDVSEADARWMVDRLRQLLSWAPMSAGLGGDPDFLSFVSQYRDNLDVVGIAAAIDSDPSAWANELRAAIHGKGPAPVWLASALPEAWLPTDDEKPPM